MEKTRLNPSEIEANRCFSPLKIFNRRYFEMRPFDDEFHRERSIGERVSHIHRHYRSSRPENAKKIHLETNRKKNPSELTM